MSVAQTSRLDMLETPLPRLLTELNVKLIESTITDRAFFGAFVEHEDGSRVLSMPAGRPVFETDTVARMLLAEALGLDAPPVSAPLEVVRL